MEAQIRIIQKIANNGSCVIVGRVADYVLRGYDNVFRVFLRAPLDFRIRRVGEVYGDTPEGAKRNIRCSDRARASYYRHISGRKWGAAEKLPEMFEAVNAPKVMARKKGCGHGHMLYSADGYVTAWLLWQLQGDEEAAKAFIGESPELLENPLY